MIKALKVLLALGLVGTFAFAVAAYQFQDIDPEILESRYATEPSRFVTIDGVRFHYRDEGAGPTVVLVHANWANMLDWDPWVDALKDSYRVVRFDMPGFGLTGPDPTGDYSIARTVSLLEELFATLNVDTFVLAGASLGGTIGMHYSVAHPGVIERLIFVSPGALNPRVRGRTTPPSIPQVFNVLTVITPRAIPHAILRSGFGDESRISEQLISRWHDFLLRKGNRLAQLDRQRQYISGDVDALIGEINVPVLIMWGSLNKQVPVELAGELADLLKSAPEIERIIYEDAGHQLAQEIGERTGQDVRAYLDRKRSAQLQEGTDIE